jgi:pimeloyl-ACP methyl ester carboxylesterase
LPTSNGETIYVEYIGEISKIATDTVILYCHGNAGHMDSYWQRAKLLANVGGKNRYGVLTLDYQGYGLSSGTPSESNLYSDVDETMKWLKSQGLSDERLIIYGFSMGSAPACELTSKPRTLTPSKIILEAPFASAAVMVADGSLLDMPASYVVNLEIDNAEEIKNINQSLLWMHGNMDDFLQMPTHGQVVYNNHNGVYKEAVIADGGGHGTVPQTIGIDAYKQIVLDFITKH